MQSFPGVLVGRRVRDGEEVEELTRGGRDDDSFVGRFPSEGGGLGTKHSIPNSKIMFKIYGG